VEKNVDKLVDRTPSIALIRLLAFDPGAYSHPRIDARRTRDLIVHLSLAEGFTMPERSNAVPARPLHPDVSSDTPPPEIAAFIRYCHRRRPSGWPEIYDEMCAVAARREFKGWDQEQLASRGITLSLFEMPRLAAWVRVVLEANAEPRHRPIVQRAGA
jgi:hypothetical protein